MPKPITIGLLGKGLVEWGGGIDFLRNLTTGLLVANKHRPVRVVLLLPRRQPLQSLYRAIGRSVRELTDNGVRGLVRSAARTRSDTATVSDSLIRNLGGRVDVFSFKDSTEGLAACIRQARVDVMIPVLRSLPERFSYPWVGYIYDFQHRHYPTLFQAKELSSRDEIFEQLLSKRGIVIVNSAATRRDVDRYYPEHRCEIVSLPFSPIPIPEWLEDSIADLQEYELPEKYFVICNQFWVHKDHGTAFEALGRLTALHADANIHIVCTGTPRDYRVPGHFDALKANVSRLGITPYVHFTGHVPKSHQVAIMRRAVATIQPTLFEGGPGGGAVYDSMALGVPAILSDIPVNTEIKSDRVTFFRAGDADDLARKMWGAWHASFVPIPKDQLLAQGLKRAETLGMALIDVATRAVEMSGLSVSG